MPKLQLVATYGPGCGLRADELEEVTHLSLQLVAASSVSQDVVHSQDPFEPSLFHPSRRHGLELALARRSEIEAVGFAGRAVDLRIPGIPFNQEQDAGLHISLYNQPKQAGTSYTPPNIDACRALVGKTYDVELDGALKILNGSEQNDFKVGGCYYVSLGCGGAATSLASKIKAEVGLPEDKTQEFHLSIAAIAPSWLPCHPKSVMGLQASPEQHSAWKEAFQIFRHGYRDAGFSGFNDDSTTGWTSHAAKMAEAGKFNSDIAAKIKNLPDSDEYDSEKLKLQQQIINIPKTLGFCKTVGAKEAISKINMPCVDSQETLCTSMMMVMKPERYADSGVVEEVDQAPVVS